MRPRHRATRFFFLRSWAIILNSRLEALSTPLGMNPVQTRTKPENRSARRSASGALVGVFLALLFALLAPRVARGATFRDRATASAGPGFPIAFADFNGDRRPDFARVLGGDRLSANGYDYAIWIQLSGSGRRLIRVVAPSGGLSIEARDVNGDHAVDPRSRTWRRRSPLRSSFRRSPGSPRTC